MERYKLGDIDNEKYYQIPKSLFSGETYKGLGLDAKVIYAFLKDRMGLSRKNKWVDPNGDIYLLFGQDRIAELLTTSVSTVSRALRDLEKYNLIDSKRQGLGRPNKLYIRRIKTCTYANQICTDENQTCTGDGSELAPMQGNETEYSETDSNEPDLSETESKDINPIAPKTADQSEPHNRQERFDQFWTAYPKKVGKGAAKRSYMRIKPDAALHEKMMIALAKVKLARQWQTEDGRYIPNPATWLNQRRWENEPEPALGFDCPQVDMANRAIEEIMRHG